MSERDFLRWRPDDDPGVSHHEVETELSAVVARGRHRRARRTAAIGTTLAVLLVAGGAVAMRGSDGEPSGVTAADRTSTSTSTSTSVEPGVVPTVASTTLPQHPRPPFVVVARRAKGGTDSIGDPYNTELAVLDGRTGKDIRILRRTVFYITEVRLSPDGKHVYFVEGDCGYSVMRVRVDGPSDQEPERVATDGESDDPAISFDGRFLAYMGEGDCDPAIMELRVRDLASGQERVVATETVEYHLGSMAWSPDGATLAVTAGRVQDGKTTESFIALLDPTTNQDVARAPRITSPRPGFTFSSPTYLPDGSLFLVESPLDENAGPALMLVVDARTGETRRRVATGAVDRAYGPTATDVTGSHLLYVSKPKGEKGYEEGGELRVSSNGGRTTVLARNVTAADW